MVLGRAAGDRVAALVSRASKHEDPRARRPA